MKATETKVEDFLSANKTQFVIPVYQRNYDWSTSECKQLLDDILEVGSNKDMNTHFIGSIVYIHDDVYTSSKVKELTIIDGQQRLTTLTLIYLTIFNLAKMLNDEELANEMNETYLINKYASEDEKLKLKPTENNDKAIQFLMRDIENEDFKEFSKIIDNYNYFKGRILEENYEYVLEGLSKLMFVEISLDREKDDPQRIFESLNSTGLELSQADLIRNYILMGLSRADQAKIYNKYWEIIEKYAKDESTNVSKVSEYIRDYLTLENKKIPNKNKVYNEFKLKYPTNTMEDLEAVLIKIRNWVYHYNKLLNPQNEQDKDIRIQLEYINRLEINVAFPFLLKVYDDYVTKIIDKATFIDILEFIQSYTWRRFIVGLPTNALNKIFMGLYDKVNQSNYLESVQLTLVSKSGIQRFPKDLEVVEALKVKDVYGIKSKNRVYLLERLENHNNKERVQIENNTDITIEHIFPQNPDVKWKQELANDEFVYIKENLTNTISNLTLSGNNGKLGNKIFKEKRDMKDAGYKESRLWLNKDLANYDKWGKTEIEKRFERLSKRFLEIWKFPEIKNYVEDTNGEINIFDAEEPKHKKLEYAIFFNQKLNITQVSKLYFEVIRQLFDLQPETFFTTDLAERISLTKKPGEKGIRRPIALNEIYFMEGNIDNIGKFERIKHALTLYGFEDELIIKYLEENK
ncbi:conserved protein of unknown function [Acetoanaerobium sticklandii]|uniref:DUF262 domain-containing protein n=1 Tax=Acetoanaerobium sticklandii (strain ATCC 12662 / DSM 519 / JCM 1433 / CCUG 9281 / NCIMB 10654 / HF) TaxID=499177 RepID=E3PWP6_ACESD|nr:DUF262 domain-containing protein [Acetoanaerobium sticklandii]CBH20861.1 conserved protein of unknown function [Acetoanaerobium sticklandii]